MSEKERLESACYYLTFIYVFIFATLMILEIYFYVSNRLIITNQIELYVFLFFKYSEKTVDGGLLFGCYDDMRP